jgi:hypothetical protein
MIIDDAIREAKSDRQICALLMAYMESVDPDIVDREQDLDCGDIDHVRARFRKLIHELDKVSSCSSDKRPVINQALYIYSEALSRLQVLSAVQPKPADAESTSYLSGFMPQRESALLAA